MTQRPCITDEQLSQIAASCRAYTRQGQVASYIPELSKSDPNDLGVFLTDAAGSEYKTGDWDKCFTIQSVVKPLLLLLALIDRGEADIRARIGVESTGKPFDAIMTESLLTSEHLNPMVNIGAIELCTLIGGGTYEEKYRRLLAFVRQLTGNPDIRESRAVYLSEKGTGNKNRAFAYLLKAYNLIHDDIEDVLDFYFKACSILVTSRDLSRIGAILANGGSDSRGIRYFDARHARYVNAIMMTCGMYDGSGAFAIDVGVPAKSGVGGGIMAVVPGKMGIGIYSPSLDKKGNSIAGIQVLHRLSAELSLSIF